jgi:hypothetical protein
MTLLFPVVMLGPALTATTVRLLQRSLPGLP